MRTELYRSYALRFVDSLATNTLVFALPLMIYSATNSLTWSGAAFLIEWLPRLLSLPVAGVLVDKVGPRRIFIATNLVRAAVLLGTAPIMMMRPGWWPLFIGIAVINGIAGQLSFVAAEHLGVSVRSEKARHEVQSVQVSIDQTVTVLGPLLAGALIIVSAPTVLTAVGLMALTSVFAARTLQVHGAIQTKSLSVRRGFLEGVSVIASSRTLQYVIAGTVAFNLLLAFITVMTPAIVKGRFAGTDTDVTLLWAVGAVASIVAVALASRLIRRGGIVRIGAIAGCLASVAIACASMAHSLVAYVICVALFIAMDGVYAVYIRTARAKIVPLEQFGVTVGVIVLLSIIPFPLAGLLVAVIAPSALSVVLVGCTVLCLVVTILSYIKIDASLLASEKV
ncbi:MAG TPA: MFS transporter [Candidatus Saccharimonadales bacterium]|nr:MFS transporter [Candidatus Saccharimonadales bacterium]